jgi:hypothetical protein
MGMNRKHAKADLETATYDVEDFEFVPQEEANLVTSVLETDFPLARNQTFHAPVLDIDIPHKYVPSSTPGHGHLYLDVVVQWSDYVKWLQFSAELGIIESGWVDAALKQGFTAVRKEGVVKTDAERKDKDIPHFDDDPYRPFVSK